MKLQIKEPIQPLLHHLIEAGFTPVIVGGYVRDALLNHPSKDIDIEVFNVLDIEQLKLHVKPFGAVYEVGSSFGVLKMRHDDIELDISLPRTESKVAKGHRGFCVDTTHPLTFSQAARRRDFTINAMGYDVASQTLLDPYKGAEDLQQKILREVDADTFIEDPLRLYRAVQFAARFELTCSESLLNLCTEMVKSDLLLELPKERIFEEFKKLLLKAKKPSIGMLLMEKVGVFKYFSELEGMSAMKCHSQNDIFKHTIMTLDQMASMRCGEHRYDLMMMLAILCHKMPQNGRSFLEKLTNDQKLIDDVTTLVQYNRQPQKMYDAKADDYAILQLATKVKISDLIHVAKAIDLKCNREISGYVFEAGVWLQQRAKALHVTSEPLEPLLKGRDLIALGLQPSNEFKKILDTAYEAQLQGEFTCKTEAMEWLKNFLSL
jgi:tRNA nucleotidyltransferase (CCA-adding enzyme)